jgi:hypothetical protein
LRPLEPKSMTADFAGYHGTYLADCALDLYRRTSVRL